MAAKLKADKRLVRKEITKLLRSLSQPDIQSQCELLVQLSEDSLVTDQFSSLGDSGTGDLTACEDIILPAK